MERAATHARCPVASEVSGEVSEVSAMRKIGQLQGQRTRRPYSSDTTSANKYDDGKGNNMDRLEREVSSACESTCTSFTSILMMPLGIQRCYLGEGLRERSVGGLSE